MSDPLSALRDDYDRTWERLSRLESENAALKKMIVEWAGQLEGAVNQEPCEFSLVQEQIESIAAAMREAAK